MVETRLPVSLRLELKALVGGTRVSWVQEAWLEADTSEALVVSVPSSLLEHPEAEGMPIEIFGVARTQTQSFGVPGWRGIIRQDGEQRIVEAGGFEGAIPYRPGLYPDRRVGRAREGAHPDDLGDTGLDAGGER